MDNGNRPSVSGILVVMRLLLLLGALTGCDAVFGLDDAELPKCVVDDGFERASKSALQTQVDAFSLAADREHGIASHRGIIVATEGADAAIGEAIDLEPMYPMTAVAVEPNNDYFMFTAAFEPPEILAVTTVDGKLVFDTHVPKGTIAGTPTNRMSGKPVRVMVRLFQMQELFQEYERADDGTWSPVGARLELRAVAGANMTQDGLAIVFDGFHKDNTRGVYIAQRGSIDDSFETPQLVLEGVHAQPQLFDTCNKLYAIDEGEDGAQLTRYIR